MREALHFPVFKKDGLIIVTSFKVMYSLFNSRAEFERIFWNRRTIAMALSNRCFGRPETSYFIRNPINRFYSYFNDKFRKEPSRVLALENPNEVHLQNCQRLWLDSHGYEGYDTKGACEKLLEVDPNSVVAWLTNYRDVDVHTVLQIAALNARWRGIKVRLNPKFVFLMDQPKDLEVAGERLGFNFGVKRNSTSFIDNPDLTKSSYNTLKELYDVDYRAYNALLHTEQSLRSLTLKSVLSSTKSV